MAREQEDWLKLHTKILDNPFLIHNPRALQLWFKLLLLVKRAKNPKGQWIGNLRELANQGILPMPLTTLHRTLHHLEKQGMVELQTERKYTVITISNWAQYQGSVERKVVRKRNARGTHAERTTPVNVGQIESKSKSTMQKREVVGILQHYNDTFGSALKPLPARMELIAQSLDVFTEADLKRAITNAKAEPWFNGQNQYNFHGDLDWLLKKPEKIEQYMAMGPPKQKYF